MPPISSIPYDLIVFGATGYTGKLTAEHITTHLPTDLRWAVAGRSESKLFSIVNELKTLNPDRLAPRQSLLYSASVRASYRVSRR